MEPLGSETVILSYSRIMSLRSQAGGFNSGTIKALGIAWPPREGWVKRFEGTRITREQWDRVVTASKTLTKCQLKQQGRFERQYHATAK